MLGLSSSPVCLTVIWLLLWSTCFSWAQNWTNDGVHYGMLESNVTLACGTLPLRMPVEWRLNQSSTLPWHRVTEDGTLVLLNVGQSAQGNYSCHDDTGSMLHSIRLRLGYAPGPLNVSCRVPSHSHVRCSWGKLVRTFLPAQYNASYKGSGSGQEWRPCVVDPALEHCDITWPPFWQTIHLLNITETNPLGSTPTTLRIKLHDLLRPHPPEKVSAAEQAGFPTRLRVSWDPPVSWTPSEGFPLLFQIRYRPQGSSHWSQIEVGSTSPQNEVTIADALAGHPHQVQVRAQDGINPDGKWSDWSPLLLAWPWAAHSTEPDPSMGTISGDIFVEESEAFTVKSQNDPAQEEEEVSLVILLVLFSVVIFVIILSLIQVMCMRQRRRYVTKQEPNSMVKMKTIPL